MGLNSINGQDLVEMLKAGCSCLEKNRARVDALNVFPVPDGDTGTNMYLTLVSAVKEAEKKVEMNIGQVGKAVSMGSLMGARGNSGVILSQIFRGIAKELEGKETVDARVLAAALQSGSDTAYKAVMKPVEGTILTVAREVARGAAVQSRKSDDIVEVLQTAMETGNRVLQKTPQMLSILKEAGVVDAGGQGFLYFLEGMIAALIGGEQEAPQTGLEADFKESSPSVLDFQYCTEVLIRGFGLDIEEIRNELEPLGDSLLVVGEDDLVKVHIHSNHPGRVLEACVARGTLHDIKINNMEEEVEARLETIAEKDRISEEKKLGLVAVSQGEGWNKILSSLGVDTIVEGGQTMNPSTEDLLTAINQLQAEEVILLPNNKNVIMAACQARDLAEKPVQVISTTSVMQAVAALVVFDRDLSLDEVTQSMSEEIGKIKTGEVTSAVRDSQVNGLNIKADDYLGLIEDKVKISGETIEEVVMLVLKEIADEGDLITIYYGKDVTLDEAQKIKDQVEESYPEYDVELHNGGQPFYHYLISVE